jgi:hypothetical protein
MGLSTLVALCFVAELASSEFIFPSTFVTKFFVQEEGAGGSFSLYLDSQGSRVRYDSQTDTEKVFGIGAQPTSITSVEDFGGGNGS